MWSERLDGVDTTCKKYCLMILISLIYIHLIRLEIGLFLLRTLLEPLLHDFGSINSYESFLLCIIMFWTNSSANFNESQDFLLEEIEVELCAWPYRILDFYWTSTVKIFSNSSGHPLRERVFQVQYLCEERVAWLTHLTVERGNVVKIRVHIKTVESSSSL